MITRVIGVGQPFAGDDGVGVAVVERLASTGLAGVELVTRADPDDLPALLEGASRVVLVDALEDEGPPGRVLLLTEEALARARASLSSHGLGVPAAIELARALGATARVDVVAITIASARRFSTELSLEVALGAERAVSVVSDLIRGGKR